TAAAKLGNYALTVAGTSGTMQDLLPLGLTVAPASQPPPPGMKNIQHIVFIIKENRSFDQYFGTFPGADGATTGKTSAGTTIPLGQTPDKMAHDIGHGWTDAHVAIDNGKMDKFDLVSHGSDLTGYTQMHEAD